MLSLALAASALCSAPILASRPAAALEPGVLTVAQGFDPLSLWPNSSTTQEQINVGNMVVESLFWVDPKTNKTEPVLAERYELVDPKTVRLTLREGVKFTNGEPFNADAVVHSFNVFTDVKTTPAYGRYATTIDRAEKIDDKTVVVHMKYPYPALDLVLSQVYILPPKYWQEAGGADGFGRKPIGTGPFKLTEWVRDSRIVMDANPDYWGKLPQGIKKVVWRPVPDDTVRAAGLMAGEFDIATNITIASATQARTQSDLQIVEVPSYRIFTVGLSNLPDQKGPLHDKRVRQAINYAVDKKALIDGLFLGNARPLHGQLLRKEQVGFDPTITDYPYDPAKAKALLAEAGFANGLTLVFKFPTGRYAQDREVAEAVAGMLAEVGVKAQMVSLEPGEFLRQLSARELQPMGFVGLAPADDPDLQMSQYRSDWRYSYLHNPELDKLIDAGGKEMDSAKRAEIYKAASKLVYDDANVLFLFQSIDLYGASTKVKNFLPRGDQRWTIYGMSKD
jgi:peptide/nickel transport system substrate-binding protein